MHRGLGVCVLPCAVGAHQPWRILVERRSRVVLAEEPAIALHTSRSVATAVVAFYEANDVRRQQAVHPATSYLRDQAARAFGRGTPGDRTRSPQRTSSASDLQRT